MLKNFWQLIGLLCLCAALTACAVPAAGAAELLQPTPTIDRLAAPPMPEHPTQADLGAHVYYQVCMACHGDRGQGLTDEWREIWEEDANCWQAECHGNDHPSWGFSFPPTCCTAIIGPISLPTFQNAQELFTYTITEMPWWNPGYLKTEEFWQVTAYLMRANHVLPEGVVLDENNAFVYNLHPVDPHPEDNRAQILLVTGLLAAIAGLVFFQSHFSNGSSSQK
ncbi:MAG: c-type cytochrome [Anaerolineales bacterium]|nr:c-type cytochrome [Anaerolineales bacterium]